MKRPVATTRKPRGGSLEPYFRDVGKTVLLSAHGERDLACRLATGDREARDLMIRANLRLVVAIARRFQGRGVDLEDLIGAGNTGLIHAIDGFDPERGCKLGTYAVHWIKQAIRREITERGTLIHVPGYAQHLASRVALGQAVPTRRQRALLAKAAIAITFRGQSPDDEVNPAILPCPRSLGPEGSLDAADLAALVPRLGPRDAAVIRLRFGLDGGEGPLTLQGIAERLGVSRERVRQIEDEAITRLRAMFKPSDQLSVISHQSSVRKLSVKREQSALRTDD